MKQSECVPVLVVRYNIIGQREYNPNLTVREVERTMQLWDEEGRDLPQPSLSIEYRSHIQCASCLAPVGQWCRDDCEQLPRFAHQLTGKRLH